MARINYTALIQIEHLVDKLSLLVLGPRQEGEVPMEQLRIAIADSNPVILDALRERLASFGHEVVAACSSGEDLIAACLSHRPNLIISDLGVTCKVDDLIAAVHKICGETATPVIIVSADSPEHIEEVRLGSSSIMAHLIRPVSAGSLAACISLSMTRFAQYAAVVKEVADLKNSIQERKLIERAKGILMDRANLTEAEAHERLQKLASTRNIKMFQVADIIIAAEVEFDRAINRVDPKK